MKVRLLAEFVLSLPADEQRRFVELYLAKAGREVVELAREVLESVHGEDEVMAETAAQEPGYITVSEAAQTLGVSVVTIRQQIRRGTIRAVRLGREYLIEPSEVERYRRLHLGRRGRKPKPRDEGVQ